MDHCTLRPARDSQRKRASALLLSAFAGLILLLCGVPLQAVGSGGAGTTGTTATAAAKVEGGGDLIFEDGFESGDLSAWSSTSASCPTKTFDMPTDLIPGA